MLTMDSIPPAPSPCMARPAMNASISVTSAHMRLPMKKMALAPSRMGLRPQMSESLPHDGVLAVWARVKAVPIQV